MIIISRLAANRYETTTMMVFRAYPVGGEINAKGIVQLVKQLYELFLAKVGGRKAVACAHGATGGRVSIVGVYVCQQSRHDSRHSGTEILG